MDKTTENKVADAVLETPIKITISGRKFVIPRPTLGTIIEISSMMSEFGEETFSMNIYDSPTEVLRLAKKYGNLPKVLAMMILGAKSATRKISLFGKNFVFDRPLRKLANWLSDNITPKGMAELVTTIFGSMECAFFLATITSLNKANHIAPTKTETTPSGQPSQVSASPSM